jgi:Dual specificity phosphatase, catalytic domain
VSSGGGVDPLRHSGGFEAPLHPYPSTRDEIVGSYRQPLGRIWLRVLARLMEWLADIQPKQLNYSDVTPQLAVGGAFRKRQIKRLRQRGVTAVVDCRLEAQDDAAALAQAGIELLHLPAPDRYGFTYTQMQQGVDWVLDRTTNGGRAFLHCEHGVGRGPLMTCAVLVAQGYSAPEALRIVRSARWQALPNDRQLAALVDFEQTWRKARLGTRLETGECDVSRLPRS